MNRVTLLAVTATLVMGFFLGRLTSQKVTDPTSNLTPAEIAATTPAATGEDDSLRQELSQATAANAELADRLHTAQVKLDAEAAADSKSIRIPRKLVSEFRFQAFTFGDYRVSKDLVDLLSLTDEESESLNRALGSAADQLRHLQTDRASTVSQTPSETKIAIGPFLDEGKQVRDAIAAQATATLGADRGTQFMQVLDQNDPYYFANEFGKSKVQVTVTAQSDGTYVEKVEYGNGSSTTRSSSAIPSDYAHLFDPTPASGSATTDGATN